eukprot:TRINITY_DN2018_c0_g1_i2.p1 TRINITY_DN2018_c0_g1~~TRINITY_DN2018_c0_g1_i2.p1  ORF type:complete len:250 (-),score=60.24 TRINITY_DN2018_c0_g1_i2:192-941(-)
MSAGELTALIQGLFCSRTSQRMEVSPDNSCCFCLTLRSGTLSIGVGYCILYISMFTWYLTCVEEEGFAVTSLDMSVFSIFSVQILVNILLLVGTMRRMPCHTLPWLCANAVSLMIAMVCIVVTILFGTTKLSLNYSEYVTSLTVLGMFTAINLFCWIVVFTFRKNMVMESQMVRTADPSPVSGHHPSAPTPNVPPPSYYEIECYKECKPPPEDAPPEYEEAVSMLSSQPKDDKHKGPVLRKKSLINNAV